MCIRGQRRWYVDSSIEYPMAGQLVAGGQLCRVSSSRATITVRGVAVWAHGEIALPSVAGSKGVGAGAVEALVSQCQGADCHQADCHWALRSWAIRKRTIPRKWTPRRKKRKRMLNWPSRRRWKASSDCQLPPADCGYQNWYLAGVSPCWLWRLCRPQCQPAVPCLASMQTVSSSVHVSVSSPHSGRPPSHYPLSCAPTR